MSAQTKNISSIECVVFRSAVKKNAWKVWKDQRFFSLKFLQLE